MISFILSILGLLAFGILCFVLGAVCFCVGMGEIYKRNGKQGEFKEIIKFIQENKKGD